MLGPVRNSTAIIFAAPDQGVEAYIGQAGGATPEADLEHTYVLKPDGTAVSAYVKMEKIEAGDTIIVPVSTEPKVRTLPMLRDIATILAGFTLPFATVVALFKK